MAEEQASSLFNTPEMMGVDEKVLLPVNGCPSSTSSTSSTVEPHHAPIFSIQRLSPYTVKRMETRQEERLRVKETCNALALLNSGKTIMACSHGSPCTHIYEELMGHKYEGPPFGYTCISIYGWTVTNDGESVVWKNLCVNDLTHTTNHGNTVHITVGEEEKARL
jgi:broad specificity phosphatase PhoE